LNPTPQHHDLEVLLPPHEAEPGLAPLIALDVQRGTQPLGAAEEHTGLGGRVDLADALEDHVPVGAAEVGRRAQARDGVIDHYVGCVVGLDLRCEVLRIGLALFWAAQAEGRPRLTV